MGYPERLLSDNEAIASQFRPHWSGIIRELVLVLLVLVLLILLAVNYDLPGWLYGALGLGCVLLIANGLIRWLTTWHVITNERVIYRAGLISKRGKEIPLERINDVAFSQTIIERIFHTGDLLIESAGTHGQSRYRDIPGPEEVQSLIYRVREDRIEAQAGGAASAPGETSASQLETLSRLHDEGKLSDEEFEAEKRRILGG